MSLFKKKAVNSLKWNTIRTLIVGLLGPILLIIKTNYLSPREFGIMSIINIFIMIIGIIENFGLNTAVIRQNSITDEEKSSLLLFQLLLSTGLTVSLILISPVAANIFNMPELYELLSLLSLTIIFNGPITLFSAYLERDFIFKELSIIHIIKEVLNVLLTFVLLAYFKEGLISVVISQIISSLVKLILIFLVCHKYNLHAFSLKMNFYIIKGYAKFGIAVAAKQIVIQITHTIDEFIIGLVFSSETLGLYYFAKNLINRLRVLLSISFSKIMLPLLSKYSHDSTQLTQLFRQLTKLIAVVSFPIFIGISLTSEFFIPIFFDERWLGSIVYIYLFSLSYIPYLISLGLGSNLMYSLNKPRLSLKIEMYSSIIYLILLILTTYSHLNIIFIAIIYAGYIVGKSIVIQYYSNKLLRNSLIEYAHLFKTPLFGSIVMTLIIMFYKIYISIYFNPILNLLFTTLIGSISFIIVIAIIDNNLIKNIFSKFKLLL